MKNFVIIALSLAGIFFAVNTSAEEATLEEVTVTLEEVVVTAQRRAESLQDVPISLIAFSGDMVNEAGITGMADVALRTPNLTLTTFNIAEPQIYIRGIGTTNDSGGSDPAVGFFIDDVYIGRPGGASTDYYDIERIEVLRGPQGTLYGKNTAGGAINIFTKKPQQEFEAKAGLTVGSDNLVNLRGYVNGPFSDTIAGKITVNFRKRDGFAKNITTGQDLEDDDSKSVRGQLLFTPSEKVDILLGFDYTDIDNTGANRYITNLDIPGLPGLANIPPLLAAQRAANVGLDERTSNQENMQYSEKEILGFLGRADVDLDWATLTSITAYRDSDSSWFQPLVPQLSTRVGGLGIYEVDDSADTEADQFSQEFRLASEGDNLTWVVGLFYLKENVERSETFFTYWDARTPLAGLSLGDVTFNQEASTESTAAFGQITWNATDALALTLGARYTKDKKDIWNQAVNNHSRPAPTGIPLVGPPYEVSAEDSWDDTTLRATVDWRVTDDHMLYFTYSEGFKSGAFNGTQGTPIAASTPLDPESATNYEVGAKTQWLDNRLRFNIAYFELDYDDLQVWFLENAVLHAANATASVSGVELDFAALITENFIVPEPLQPWMANMMSM